MGDAPGRRVLRCDKCKQSAEFSHDELMRYTRTGWPRCCGETMALLTETPTKHLDGTTLNFPHLMPDDDS